MQEKVINDLDNVRELLENFYVKYGINKNTSNVKDLKDIIEELKTIDFQDISDVNRINSIIKKLNVTNKVLNRILERLSAILFEYYTDFQNYPELKKYLINRKYYSKDDRDKAFIEQLEYNDYDIYLINGTNLVNLFHREKIIPFATKDELNKYIEENKEFGFKVIIKPKTDNFEEEYKNYYSYLLKHGYNYSINDKYDPFTIASELTSLFEGQVLTEGGDLPFYSKSFKYPTDFNNVEYLEKLKDFLALNEKKEFVKDYGEMQDLKKKIQLNIDKLFSLSQRYEYVIEKLKENLSNSLSSEILFLDKCYTLFGPKFGYWEYIYEDYYKALDFEFLRKSLGKKDLGAWKIRRGIKSYWDESYTTCLYARYFSWGCFLM